MSDFFRTSDTATRPIEARYSKLGLTDNPFPQSPGLRAESNDPRTNGSIYEPKIRIREQERFEDLFVPHQSRPHTKKLVFVMDHATRRGRGIGKSSFLHHQTRRINDDWGSSITGNSHVLFSAQIQPIANMRKFWELARLIAISLNEQQIIAKAMWRIRLFSKTIKESVLSEVTDPESTIGNDEWLRKHKEEPMFLGEEIFKYLAKNGIENDAAGGLGRFGHNANQFEEIFLDQKTESYWRKNGPDFVFNSLVSLFRLARIDCGLLLVDEVEKIVVYQNRGERRGFVDALRYNLFDGNTQCAKQSFFRVLLTIHPYIQELLLPHWESSGLDRFAALSRELADSCTVYFKPMEDDVAEDLVAAYIKMYRLGGQRQDSIAPFDKEAIREALVYSKKVPGKMLAFLHELIEYAAESELTRISIETVKKFMENKEPEEPLEIDHLDSIAPTQLKADLQGKGLL